SYMCRYIAKNIVAAGLAEKCEIQVAYTIGRAHPVSVMVGAYSTGVLPSIELTEIVKKEFDLRPAAIIERLDLLRPIYRKTCNYGHFGRERPEFTWEKTDAVAALKKAVK
ncbi:MAG: methionine adenosyltransferase domain-containing protein, partial [Desulfobacteraceae bacterium]|nr:methionine adenosyltransferase domain-containing protein [Desulfobacteraceae bacterium]